MHSEGLRLFTRMTKAVRRRWIVRTIELCFWMVFLSVCSVGVCLLISEIFKCWGVA